MKLSARISAGALQRQLTRLAAELEPAVVDALAKEFETARRGEDRPMRAAVQARVRDAVAAHAGKHLHAALRDISRHRSR